MSPEEYDCESFRQSYVFPLFPLLRTRLIHRTSMEGYKSIRQGGYILANQGQFPYSYPQSKVYFSHSKNYISLFDLETANEMDCISIHRTWAEFFCDHKPVTILLCLNRQVLAADLIPNSAGPKTGSEGYKGYIPYVEAWYPKPIPFSAIESRVITFYNTQSHELLYEEFALEKINEFDDIFRQIEGF